MRRRAGTRGSLRNPLARRVGLAQSFASIAQHSLPRRRSPVRRSTPRPRRPDTATAQPEPGPPAVRRAGPAAALRAVQGRGRTDGSPCAGSSTRPDTPPRTALAFRRTLECRSRSSRRRPGCGTPDSDSAGPSPDSRPDGGCTRCARTSRGTSRCRRPPSAALESMRGRRGRSARGDRSAGAAGGSRFAGQPPRRHRSSERTTSAPRRSGFEPTPPRRLRAGPDRLPARRTLTAHPGPAGRLRDHRRRGRAERARTPAGDGTTRTAQGRCQASPTPAPAPSTTTAPGRHARREAMDCVLQQTRSARHPPAADRAGFSPRQHTATPPSRSRPLSSAGPFRWRARRLVTPLSPPPMDSRLATPVRRTEWVHGQRIWRLPE